MFKRFHFPEIEDYRVTPSWYRDLMTDCLEALSLHTHAYDNVIPLLEKLLTFSDKKQIIDFGSGGGGPWLHTMFPRLRLKFPELKLKLTDLFPNSNAKRIILHTGQSELVTYLPVPVDMTKPPADLGGIRVMFTCFHHLTEDNAKRVLQDAVGAKEPIGIFEVTGRSLLHFLTVCFIPFMVLAVTPFIRGKRIQRLFFTYLVPIVPLGCFWDGLASNFRTYLPEELRNLVSGLDNARDYTFEIGQFKTMGPIKGTFLLGYPK